MNITTATIAKIDTRVYRCGQQGCSRPATQVNSRVNSALDLAERGATALERARYCSIHAGAAKRAKYNPVTEFVSIDVAERYLFALLTEYTRASDERKERKAAEAKRQEGIRADEARRLWGANEATWIAEHRPERPDPKWEGCTLDEDILVHRADNQSDCWSGQTTIGFVETKGNGPILLDLSHAHQMTPAEALALAEGLIRAARIAESRNRTLPRPAAKIEEKEVAQ